MRAHRCLIASPSDVPIEREVIREALWRWSSVNAETIGTLLLPTMWEHDATPSAGDRPQGILNRQLVDRCDLLIGVFWRRLGMPTGDAESGTAEEIERCIDAGKPTLLYFCTKQPDDESYDDEEFSRLLAFKQLIGGRCLYAEVESLDALRARLWEDLTRTVQAELATNDPSTTRLSPGEEALALQVRPTFDADFDVYDGQLVFGVLATSEWSAKQLRISIRFRDGMTKEAARDELAGLQNGMRGPDATWRLAITDPPKQWREFDHAPAEIELHCTDERGLVRYRFIWTFGWSESTDDDGTVRKRPNFIPILAGRDRLNDPS